MTEPRSQACHAAERNGLGILGGSFNPPHASHLRIARSALEQLPIAAVRVIPAGDHPHKGSTEMAPAADRLAMCRLQFAGDPRIVVDDRELRRAGPSYTVDTLAELAAEQPGRRLFFLIGSDNLPLLPTWRDVHGILARCTVVTWPRLHHRVDDAVLAALPLTDAERATLRAHVLQMPADAIAATDLRARLRQGSTDLPELHEAVRAYIAAHRLYR
jgi:nicotinate-nucleotide adenylyltransferase